MCVHMLKFLRETLQVLREPIVRYSEYIDLNQPHHIILHSINLLPPFYQDGLP